MPYMWSLTLTILFLSIQYSFCAEVTLPNNAFIEGWQQSEALQTFYKNDLYGHINGGAELFIEFGFDSLLVQDYANREATLSLEVYCMDSPGSALGIYLMKCGQETPSGDIMARNSANKYQIQVAKNNYYIQLNNFTGNQKSQRAMPALLGALLSTIPNVEPFSLLNILSEENRIPGSEKIIRGQYAMQPIYTFGEGDILQLDGKIFGAVASFKTGDNKLYTQIIIPYPDESKANAVFNHLIKNLDPYLILIEKNESGIIFQDYKKQYGKINLIDNTIFIIIHLSIKPSL